MTKSKISNTLDGYMLLNGDKFSEAIHVPTKNTMLAIQFVYTGDPLGILKIQESVNRENWAAIRLLTIDGDYADGYSLNSEPGYSMFELENFTSPFIRLKYERSDGLGGLNYYTRYKAKTKVD